MTTLLQSQIELFDRRLANSKAKAAILRRPAVQAAIARCPDAMSLGVYPSEHGQSSVQLTVNLPSDSDKRLQEMADSVSTDEYICHADQTLYKTPRVRVTVHITATTPLARGDKTLLKRLGKIRTYRSTFKSQSVVCGI